MCFASKTSRQTNVECSDKAPEINTITAYTTADISALDTVGKELILVSGINFGEFLDAVSVTYGRSGAENLATCIFPAPLQTSAHTKLVCETSPGIGTALKWKVMVEGQASLLSSQTVSYHAPVWADPVQAVRGYEGSNPGQLRTEGGEVLYLRGRYFGPRTSLKSWNIPRVVYGLNSTQQRSVTYNASFVAKSCTVESDTEIRCLSAAGLYVI